MNALPASAVAYLDAVHGLAVHLHDGRRFASFALGDSLAGQLLGQERAHAAVRRYEDWLSAHPQPALQTAQFTVRRRVRTALLCVPVWSAGYILIAVAIRTFAN